MLTACGADGADVALDVLLGLRDCDYRSSVIAALEPWLEPSVARAPAWPGHISRNGSWMGATGPVGAGP